MRKIMITGLALGLSATVITPAQAKSEVTVMTRNIYLGADLGPALGATDVGSFISAAGEIFRQLEKTNFPRRAKGLADEIQKRKPDLIGLQEAALWRKGPVNLEAISSGKPAATEVYQDFLKILLKRVNKGKAKYQVVKIKKEFDFEAPADVDNDPSTGMFGADADFRLTMRDVILKRKGVGIKTKDIRSGRYPAADSFQAAVGPVTVTSIRGWLSTRVKLKGGKWFTFANTHLEAFDDRTEVPSIRARQAQHFAQAMAKAKGPLIAVGDFNSDSPGLVAGDEQAFEALTAAGFKDIGTKKPLSCCISGSYDMKTGGSKADFDHRVDQIFTTTPKKVKKLKTWVTGRSKSYGYWHSDHAGIVGRYRIK